ncbi:protein goliath-like isoform X2 [Daphnia pulex]|uniref:protein goliath-like isoform X2 n=1 Tax=Daphnia pulex TaxID=6669 RepID=UPI001EDDB2E9|nr:protein goliath-like isoform X2 [Daphnia pulex]
MSQSMMMMAIWSAVLLLIGTKLVNCDQWPFPDGEEYTLAHINVSYIDSASVHNDAAEMGKFGNGRVGQTAGILVHVRSANSSSHYGCDIVYENEIPVVPWIALVRRGRCNFDDKLEAAVLNNASGLVVYNNKEDGLQRMTLRNKYRDKIVAVFITRAKGEELAALVDNGTRVMMQITVGSHYTYRFTNINRTSVMFVSISFIVLMMISLAWLVFYYIQRFRYLHAKDRLSRELTSAAQKALSKIPTRAIKNTDKEVSEAECCAVCIEPYKASDVVRLLPCRHEFHKVCVDPWLLEHRTCPMCKMDILKHYGYVFTGSQESVVNMDLDAPIISGLRPGHRRGTASPVVVPAGSHHSSHQRSPSVTPDIQLPSDEPSTRTGRTDTLEPMRRESSSSPSTSSSRRYWSWPRSFSTRNNPPASTTESGVVEDATASEPTAVETQVEIECESPDASALAISSSTDSRSTNIV